VRGLKESERWLAVIDEAGCDELLGGLSAALDVSASELLGR
jgi:hypothetical protein